MPKGYVHVVLAIILMVLIFVGAMGIVLWRNNIPLSGSGNQKACTLEAKVCPDGTSVGRSGPNCEFAACPSANPSTATDISGDTTNWKSYISDKYNYSIMYPNDWVVVDDSNKTDDGPTFGEVGLLKMFPANADQTESRPYVAITLFDKKKYSSAEDFAQKTYSYTKYQILTPPDALKNLDVAEIYGLPGGGAPGPYLIVNTKLGVFEISTEMIQVIFGSDFDSPQNQKNTADRIKLYNQIFSTFKLN